MQNSLNEKLSKVQEIATFVTVVAGSVTAVLAAYKEIKGLLEEHKERNAEETPQTS